MKKVTASAARKHWFRLLDEALQGEVIAVQRKGQRLLLRRDEPSQPGNGKSLPRYKRLLRVPSADEIDRFSWAWRGAERALVSRRRRAR
jgi:hypothetical protein